MEIDVLDKRYIEGFVEKCAEANIDPVAVAKFAGYDKLAEGEIIDYIAKRAATTVPDLSSSATKGYGANRLLGAEGKSTDQALTGKRTTTRAKPKYEPADDDEGNVMTGFVPGKPGVPADPGLNPLLQEGATLNYQPEYPPVLPRAPFPSEYIRS